METTEEIQTTIILFEVPSTIINREEVTHDAATVSSVAMKLRTAEKRKGQKKQRKTKVKIVHLFHRVHRIRKAHLLSLQIQEQQNICLIKNTSSKNSQQ